MWEEKLHLLERLWEVQPELVVLPLVLFVGIMLVGLLLAIYQTIQKRRKSSETIRQTSARRMI